MNIDSPLKLIQKCVRCPVNLSALVSFDDDFYSFQIFDIGRPLHKYWNADPDAIAQLLIALDVFGGYVTEPKRPNDAEIDNK